MIIQQIVARNFPAFSDHLRSSFRLYRGRKKCNALTWCIIRRSEK